MMSTQNTLWYAFFIITITACINLVLKKITVFNLGLGSGSETRDAYK